MNKQLEIFIPLCNSIGKLFYPNVEVVLHDLKTQKLVHIINPFSKREIGDKMINDVKDIDSLTEDIVGPYNKTNIDGAKLKTVSTILRDSNKKAIGIICINFKTEVFDTMYESLKGFLNIEEPKEKPQALFSQDWEEHTLSTINTYLKLHSLKLEELKIKDKKELIVYLNNEGIFSIRNVVSYLCEILDISRATIYKYLKECK
jgi:predicted transcriptional regulator YheO